MDEFDFTDGLKIVFVSIFLLGSVQLHALIDESGEHAAARGPGVQSMRQASDVPDPVEDGAARELPLRT